MKTTLRGGCGRAARAQEAAGSKAPAATRASKAAVRGRLIGASGRCRESRRGSIRHVGEKLVVHELAEARQPLGLRGPLAGLDDDDVRQLGRVGVGLVALDPLE